MTELEYYKNPTLCQYCGEVLPYSKRNGKFCSSSCAAKYNNVHRTLNTTNKTKLAYCVDCGKEIEISIYNSADTARCEDCKRKQAIKKRLENYLHKYSNKLTCPVCGKEFMPKTLSSGFYSTSKCCSAECEHILRSNKAKDTYNKVKSEGRFKGWKSRNIISYAERFWMKVLENNDIEYQKEYSLDGKYFLDFFIEKNGQKIDLEIDGKQHTYKDRIEHDKIRDEYVSNAGFIVYRVPWNTISNEDGSLKMKRKIKMFLAFYNSL